MSLSQAQLLDILRRTTDAGWLDPLLSDADSKAVLDALTAIGARTAAALEYDGNMGLITLASGGAPGTTQVTVTRPSGSLAVLPRGTALQDERGAVYFTEQDITIPAGASVVPLDVASLRETELVNTVDDPGIHFAPSYLVAETTGAGVSPIVVTTSSAHKYADGDSIRIFQVEGNTAANGVFIITVPIDGSTGQPDRIHFSLNGTTGNAPYAGGGVTERAPLGLVITGSAPVQGGKSDYLSLHGRERGQQRQAGEFTENYRARVRNITDMVSPKAIIQAARGIAQSVGLSGLVLLEPFEDASSPSLDADLGLGSFASFYLGGGGESQTPGSPAPSNTYAGTAISPLAFSWDDPSAVYLDRHSVCAYFKITTPYTVEGATVQLSDPDPGRAFWGDFFYDDRSFGYYDVGAGGSFTPGAPPLLGGQPGGGAHPEALSAIMAIWEEVNRKRAGCVQFDIELIAARMKVLTAALDLVPTTPHAPIVVFSASPPTGKVWWIQDLVVGHMSIGVPQADPGCYHFVRFTFENGSTFETPHNTTVAETTVGADHTQPLKDTALNNGRVTLVEGLLANTAGVNTQLLAILRVLEVAA